MYLAQLLRHARPYRARLIGLAALTAASSLVLLAVPWLAGHMLGGIVSGRVTDSRGLVTLLGLCLVVLAVLNFALAYLSSVTAAQVLADLRCRLHDHVQRLPLGFHHGRQKGDTLALMTLEVARLGQFLTGTLVAFPSRLLVALGAMVLMFRIDMRLAMIVPVLIPAFYLILKIFGRRQRGLAIALQQDEAQVVSIADETIDMLPATKAFTRETAQFERYQAAVKLVFTLSVKIGRIHAALEPAIGLLASLAAVGILVLAGRSLEAGAMTASQLFSFIFYAALLTRPVGALADIYGQVQMARGTLTRLQSVLEIPAEVHPATRPAARSGGAIRFREVGFAYPDREPVLVNASFDVAQGEIVALTGSNGAGKTAIINLLMRFYQPQSGIISIDGRDVGELDVADLRRQIGLVPQSTLLFNGTIADNIAFGAESPTQGLIEEAARLSQAEEFIAALPDQFETIIGDRGTRLSGGQRQRIALARAMIKDPPILLLDEATSMFDEEGESAFVAACSTALEGRTVILITHRPATLELADRVLTIENGAVAEVARR